MAGVVISREEVAAPIGNQTRYRHDGVVYYLARDPDWSVEDVSIQFITDRPSEKIVLEDDEGKPIGVENVVLGKKKMRLYPFVNGMKETYK